MNSNSNIPITLIKYKEAKIKINDELSILILGNADEERIFMKLNINNSICYEIYLNLVILILKKLLILS